MFGYHFEDNSDKYSDISLSPSDFGIETREDRIQKEFKNDTGEAVWALVEELYLSRFDIDKQRVDDAMHYLCQEFAIDEAELEEGLVIDHETGFDPKRHKDIKESVLKQEINTKLATLPEKIIKRKVA